MIEPKTHNFSLDLPLLSVDQEEYQYSCNSEATKPGLITNFFTPREQSNRKIVSKRARLQSTLGFR